MTTTASTVKPPTAFSATAASVSQNDLAFTANAAGHNVVIVWNATGTFDSPSGTPPVAGQAFAGGTLLYNGTTSPFNHTGLNSCTKYYYRAWSYLAAGSMWSTPLNADATTATPAAPALPWASLTNYTDFTAAWDAVTGAAGYRLDVSESATFTGAGGVSARYLLASNAATSVGAITNGWSGYNLAASTYVQLLQSSSVITSPAFSTVGYTNLTVDFRARTYGGTASGTTNVTMSISTNNGTSWTSIGVIAPASSSLAAMPTLTNTANLGFEQTRIRWQTLGAGSGKGVGVDQLIVKGWSGGVASPAYVDGFENLAVAGTSTSVTGLLEATKYYFRVRAVGAGGCLSGNSPTADVTTGSGSPFAPTAAATDGTYLDRVLVTWNNVDEETYYKIWRHDLNLPGSATQIGSNTANDVDFDDTTATPGQVYYYWITAGNSIGSSPKGTSDSGYMRLSPPTDVAATDGVSTDHVAITWTAAAGERRTRSSATRIPIRRRGR